MRTAIHGMPRIGFDRSLKWALESYWAGTVTDAQLEGLLRRGLESFEPDRLWINPDCGLKTRRYEQVLPALAHLVTAARSLRAELDNDATLPGAGIDAASTQTPPGS